MCACQLGLHFMLSCSVLNNLPVVGLTIQTRAASRWWYFAHQLMAGENAIPVLEWQTQSRRSVRIMVIEPLRKTLRINALHWALCTQLAHSQWCVTSSSLSKVLLGVTSFFSVVSMQNILSLLLMLSLHLLFWPTDTCWSACSFGQKDLCESRIPKIQPVLNSNAGNVSFLSDTLMW